MRPDEEHRLDNTTVNGGLLRKTEMVQRLLTALINCDVSYWAYLANGPRPDTNTSLRFWTKPRARSV